MTVKVYAWLRKHAKTLVILLGIALIGLVLSHDSLSLSIETPAWKLRLDAR